MQKSPFLETVLHGDVGSIEFLKDTQHGVGHYRQMIVRSTELRTTLGAGTSPKNLVCYVVMVLRGALAVKFMDGEHLIGHLGIRFLTNGVPFEVSVKDECEVVIITMPSWWAMREVIADSVLRGVWSLPASYVTTGALFALVKDIMACSDSDAQGDQGTRVLSAMLRMSLSLQPDEATSRTTSVPRMSQLLGVISKNLGREGFSPNEAASILRCSLRTLHKTCADNGKTFGKLLLDMRLSWAAYQLGYTSSRISEVAFACGFTSLSHFCRSFKSTFRVTPGEFRANGLPSPMSL